jgi:putative membrane protein insertion efficiency factor
MISALKGYKAFVSPLLPPACRFLPTCSIYSMEAIRQFGPSKGAVLTAWRLVRCNPLHWAGGGRGYDPPTWPPVGYNYASSADALKQELAALLAREHAQQQRP